MATNGVPTNWDPTGFTADYGFKDEGDFAFVFAMSEAAQAKGLLGPDNQTAIANTWKARKGFCANVAPMTAGEV